MFQIFPSTQTEQNLGHFTARRYWPYLPNVDLDLMEQHHPGAKASITDLKRALHEEWDMVDGWTGL